MYIVHTKKIIDCIVFISKNIHPLAINVHISYYTRLKSDQLVIDSLIHYFLRQKKRTSFQVMKSRLVLISFWYNIGRYIRILVINIKY